MRISDPMRMLLYQSQGFRKTGQTTDQGVTIQDLREFESFFLEWVRQQEEPTRAELRKFIEGVREAPLSDFEFGMFLDYFKDWHDIEIPD